ncbi:MAG: type II toxin-antitoxin system RelE/ParE family toxin [Pseudomonadota bacterium]
MSHLKWTDAAVRDLHRAYAFWAEKDKRVAQDAIRRIRAEMRALALRPGLGRPLHVQNQQRREWIIQFGKTGYIAQYEIHGKTIFILRIKRQREKPFEPT